MSDVPSYDVIIVGGGMAGLYALQLLHQKKKELRILILDDRNYWGGRVITHQRPFYEIGGARFNDNHHLLLSLLKQYKCHTLPIPNESVFLHQMKDNTMVPYYNVNQTLGDIMMNIQKKSKQYSKHTIQQHTLKSWIDFLSKDTKLSMKIKDIFGYDSEITKMNAYDALQSFERDFVSNSFYILREGFSELCKRMYETHKTKTNITFCGQSLVTTIKRDKKGDMLYVVGTQNGSYFRSKDVICAMKAEQLRAFPLFNPIKKDLSHIYSAPLLRIYAKYPLRQGKPWFHDMPKIVTNALVRQIIPIDPSKGLIMISYTDGQDIDPFWRDKRQKVLKPDNEIKKMIETCLYYMFPLIKIPKPTFFKTHLWTIGCHHWKPKCDSIVVGRKIQNPAPHVYVIGEAVSQKQAWVEGALETAQDIMKYFD